MIVLSSTVENRLVPVDYQLASMMFNASLFRKSLRRPVNVY